MNTLLAQASRGGGTPAVRAAIDIGVCVFGSEFGRCISEAVFSSLDVEGLGWLVHSIDAAPRLCTLESEMLLCLAIRSIVRCIKNEENEFCIIFGDFVVPGFFLDT